jgi:uncharacterized protein YxjI
MSELDQRPSLPPPAAPLPPEPTTKRGRRANGAKRPWFWLIAVVGIGWRVFRDVLIRNYGFAGVLLGLGVGAALLIGWRLIVRAKTNKRGGVESTADEIRDQIQRAGAGRVAFPEDGSLLGSSLMVVNQRSKLVEVNTQYQLFGSHGDVIGTVNQIGQGRFKQFLRIFTRFDQFFTHHFDVTDRNGVVVLRMTRPAKVFRTTVNVFDGRDVYLGAIRQENVFGKIRFALNGPTGDTVGWLLAENWRAWDFVVQNGAGVEVARITKSWEGWARTFMSTADHYVVSIHHVLGDPLRALTIATALSVDLALKQDSRGLT